MDKYNLDLDKIRNLVRDETTFEEIQKIIISAVTQIKLPNGNFRFDGFFYSRTDPQFHHRIQFSPNIEEITGYTEEELNKLPGKLLSIVHPDDIEETKREYAALMGDEKRNKYQLIFRIVTKAGNVLWIRENYFLERDAEGNVYQCESLAYDITDLVKDEIKAKEENNKLRELNEQKDKFINIISHDLRAPFTSLLGFSEILINEPGLAHEERMEYLNYIHDASQTQLQFINHLLDWSRLQTGKIKVDPKRVKLKDVVSNSVSIKTHSAIRKNIEIRVNIPDNFFVSAEERLLGEVINNLVDNSIKFSNEDSIVLISANKFKTGMIEVIVKDEGIGISEENQAKLFKIDQKYIAKGTKGEKGCGMGLKLVKEIINKHNGEIWYYSKQNEGTEIHFTLHEAKNVILIVEDDMELRALYRKVLKKAMRDFEVVEAANGYEAMSSAFKQLPSLVITDHDMPLMSGTQLIEALRKKDRKNSVPVIVISAKLDPIVEKEYAKLGVNKIVHKPISIDELAVLVKNIVS